MIRVFFSTLSTYIYSLFSLSKTKAIYYMFFMYLFSIGCKPNLQHAFYKHVWSFSNVSNYQMAASGQIGGCHLDNHQFGR